MPDIKQTPKRVVMLVPGKGGTGKSLFTRLLYYAIRQAGVNAIGFDSDSENPEFGTYHKAKKHDVYCVDLLTKLGAIKMMETLEKKQPDVAVIDMPAASSQQTRNRLETLNLLDLSEDKLLPYRFTLVCVLDTGLPAVRSFHQAMEDYGDRADYVAVENRFWVDEEEQGSGFEIWESSDSHQLFQSLNGIGISMPTLDRLTFKYLHPETNFFEADKINSIGHRLITQSFLRRGVAQLDYAAAYFGLPAEQKSEAQSAASATGAAQ